MATVSCPGCLERDRRIAALERRVAELEALVRDQTMSMKTTFTPGHYRRRVAAVLARRLVARLFAA